MVKTGVNRISRFYFVFLLFSVLVIACRIGSGGMQAPEVKPQDQAVTKAIPSPTQPAEAGAAPQSLENKVLFLDDFQDGQLDNCQVISI